MWHGGWRSILMMMRRCNDEPRGCMRGCMRDYRIVTAMIPVVEASEEGETMTAPEDTPRD